MVGTVAVMAYDIKKYCDLVASLSEIQKQEACLLNRGMADTHSFVSLSYRDDVMTIEGSQSGNPVQNLPDVLDQVMKTGIVKFDALSFTAEVFMRRFDLANRSRDEVNELVDTYKRGDLEKEYKENPLSDIIEGLFTVAISWAGDTAYCFTEVKYDDKGQPVYGRMGDDDTPSHLQGAVARTLNDYRIHCHSMLGEEGGTEYQESFDDLYNEMGNLRDAVAYIQRLIGENPELSD